VASLSISPDAVEWIEQLASEPHSPRRPSSPASPQFAWASGTRFTDLEGQSRELGPCFYFSWVTAEMAPQNACIFADVGALGRTAFAPGGLFREGDHAIGVVDGRLSLDGQVPADFSNFPAATG